MKRFLAYSPVALFFFLGGPAWAYTAEDCIKCHEEGSSKSMLHISIKEFKASIHGEETVCEDCHTSVKSEDHERRKGSGAVDCRECHEEENRHGLQSEGGRRPQCYSCHTRHSILEKDNPTSSIHPKRLKETCKICHKRECGEINYLSRLPSLQIASHKKEDFSKTFERTNCVGCHQGMAAHGEENQLNDEDCHKCHLTTAGQSRLMGYIHPTADREEQPETFAVAVVYQVVAVILLWGGLRFYVRRFSRKTKEKG